MCYNFTVMKNGKTEKNYIKRTGTLVSYAILFGISAATVVFCAMLQPGKAEVFFNGLGNQPLLVFLNSLPVFVTAFFAFGITNNSFVSGGITYLLWMTLSYVNNIKITLRNDPFIPQDMFQAKEGLYAVKDFDISVDYRIIAAITVVSLAIFAAGFFIRTVPVSGERRGLRLLLAVVIIVAGYEIIYDEDNYSARNIYWNKLTITDETNTSLTTEEVGFIYKFCYSTHAYGFHKPEGYDSYSFKAEEKAYYNQSSRDAGGGTGGPYVIMVMCEAFSDISEDGAFAYTYENDPLYNFHRIEASGTAVSGHIVVPNVGAGTSNTEFDVLTGVQARAVAGDSNVFFSVRRPTDTVATVLKKDGYETFFTHPGRPWYYNRSAVYDRFGFDDLVFANDSAYENAEYTGTLISDNYVGDVLIKRFEDSVSRQSGPVFEFGVTIQNHMPYRLDRYGRTWGMTEEVPLNVPVSQESLESLSVYIEGVRAGDELLGRLADYLAGRNEPAILVFFGDHRPSLGEDFSVYKKLGIPVGGATSPEEVLNTYETPYIIWANPAAVEAGYGLTPRADYTISANYLGPLILQAAGKAGNDPYFSFLSDNMNYIQAIRDSYLIQGQGGENGFSQVVTDTSVLPEEYKEKIRRMNCWGYYRIK